MKSFIALILLTFCHVALAGNAQVLPGREFSFPQDHNLHPEFQTEWWYITTILQGDDDQDYGAQFTLFAHTIEVNGKHQRVYFAHAALTSKNKFYHSERFARADMKHAGVAVNPWQVFIDHWSFTGANDKPLPGTLKVEQPDFGYQLKLSNANYFLQGDNGYSAKSNDGKKASYYYNAPFIKATGSIRFKDKTIKVTGDAWLDREWSSGMFNIETLQSDASQNKSSSTTDKSGWDWFALRLSQQQRLMIYKVNHQSANKPNSNYLFGTLMNKDGSQIQLNAAQIHLKATKFKTFAGKQYPINWQLNIPSQNINLNLSPLNENQYLNNTIPYWEGVVYFNGSHQGKGYLELFY